MLALVELFLELWVTYPFIYLLLGLGPLYLALSQFRWSDATNMTSKPNLHFQQESKFIEGVIENCSTLKNGYHPVPVWGKNGHAQTFLFGTKGRWSAPEVQGERFSVVAADGSTLHYDVYEPEIFISEAEGNNSGCGTLDGCHLPFTFFVVPGINNSSESDYIKSFAAYGLESGYRVIVHNHLGALKSEKLTAHRIFTYGGTDDVDLVFKDACRRYPQTTFIGCGFSLGGCILVRFLGEKKERRQKFICASSLCQGYDPLMHMPRMFEWKRLRRFYSFQVSKSHKKIISRHKDCLLPKSFLQDFSQSTGEVPLMEDGTVATSSDEDEAELPEKFCNGFETELTHNGHNSNGYSLNKRTFQMPDERKIWSSTSMVELDEAYTRRVLGFKNVEDMYQWVSCTELLNQIDDLPLLFVNSLDDPCVVEESHIIAKEYAENHSKSLFVQTHHGGHLGYFEGGVVPNTITWLDRLVLDFSNACIQADKETGSCCS